jgi:hypothetical protein
MEMTGRLHAGRQVDPSSLPGPWAAVLGRGHLFLGISLLGGGKGAPCGQR